MNSKDEVGQIKKISATLAIVSVLVFLLWLVEDHKDAPPPLTTSRFQTGQVWTFHTPPNEPTNILLTVAHVDIDQKEGPIIYVSTPGRHNLEASNVFFSFSEEALNRSVISLVSTNAAFTAEYSTDFFDAYEGIAQEVAAGKSDKYFKITVGEVLGATHKGNYSQ